MKIPSENIIIKDHHRNFKQSIAVSYLETRVKLKSLGKSMWGAVPGFDVNYCQSLSFPHILSESLNARNYDYSFLF